MAGGSTIGVRGADAAVVAPPTAPGGRRSPVVVERRVQVRRSRLPFLDVVDTRVLLTFLDEPDRDGYVTMRRRVLRRRRR